MEKSLNIDEIYDILIELQDKADIDKRLKLNRFIDKLSDSDKFIKKVGQRFNQRKMNLVYSTQYFRDRRMDYRITNDLEFKWNGNSYDLYLNDKLFLSELDIKLAKKITKDINVAILIKLSRCQAEI